MTETHAAFIELADLFKELPETFTDEFKEVTPQAQLQGYRHLAHLLAYGFELYMESDPLRPFFVPVARYTQKILGDRESRELIGDSMCNVGAFEVQRRASLAEALQP